MPEFGLQGWPEDLSGPRPPGFDGFFSMIAFDELSRCASGGVVWGLTGGFGIGMPPIVHFADEALRQRVAVRQLVPNFDITSVF